MSKLVIILASAFASAGTLVMRYGGQNLDFSNGIVQALRDGYLWFLGIVMGWVAGMIFAVYLTRTDISSAISFYVPLTYTLTFIGGVILLREPISPYKALGGAFIIAGLFFIVKSS